VRTITSLWTTANLSGNLPVDSAIFLEFLPGTHQYLLTVLSIDWALAQLLATLIAWPLLGNLTCQQGSECTRADNMGWRYFTITMGGITLLMWASRFFLFTIYESPKYLMGKGRDEDAVRIVHEVARRNKKSTSLGIEDLRACEQLAVDGAGVDTSNAAAIKRQLQKFNLTHVRALFSSRRMAFSTSIIMTIWGLIGLAYPLYK
jgi:MFS family permease